MIRKRRRGGNPAVRRSRWRRAAISPSPSGEMRAKHFWAPANLGTSVGGSGARRNRAGPCAAPWLAYTANTPAEDSPVSISWLVCPLSPDCWGSTKCTLSCGLFSLYSCAPVTCGTANPWQCLPSTSCPSGWTVSGSKCFNVFPGPSNWLAALQTCIAQGGTLAKVESQAEQDLVLGLLNNSDLAWIGLQVSGEAGRGWRPQGFVCRTSCWRAPTPGLTAPPSAPTALSCRPTRPGRTTSQTTAGSASTASASDPAGGTTWSATRRGSSSVRELQPPSCLWLWLFKITPGWCNVQCNVSQTS